MTEERKPEHRYPRVVAAMAQMPWAITVEMLATIQEIIRFRASGGRLSQDEIRAVIGSGPVSRDPFMQASAEGGAVAVLPLYGVIAPKVNVFTEYSGGTALSQFRASFQQVLADPGVGAILIDCDTPGGSVALVPETAAEIRAARGTKPIVAIANTLCASAGYHLACQADEVVATPSALVGSIGVYDIHDNLEEALAMAGVDRTLIFAGQFKVDGNPWEPLSATARAARQQTVDEYMNMFVADVAAGRGVKEDAVRNGFGQGRVLTATQSLAEGLVDRIATFDETLMSMMAPKRSPKGAAAASQLDTEALAEAIAGHLAPRSAVPAEDEPDEISAMAGLLRQAAATTTEEETQGA